MLNKVATRSEKSGKTKKVWQKSRSIGVFDKKSENLIKFELMSGCVYLNLQNSLFSKAFKWLKKINSLLKSDLNCAIFLKIYKSTYFPMLSGNK